MHEPMAPKQKSKLKQEQEPAPAPKPRQRSGHPFDKHREPKLLERVADGVAKQAMWSVAYAVMNIALPGSGDVLRIGRRIGDIVDGLQSLGKGHGARIGIPLLHDQDSGLGISATLQAGGPKGTSLGIDGLFALGDPPTTFTPAAQKSLDQARDLIKPVTILGGPSGVVTLPEAPTHLTPTTWPDFGNEALDTQELPGSPVEALLSPAHPEELCLVIVRPARELATELGVTRLDGEALSGYGTRLVARRLRDGTPRAAREAMRAALLLKLVIYLDPDTTEGLCVLLDEQGPVATAVIPADLPPSR